MRRRPGCLGNELDGEGRRPPRQGGRLNQTAWFGDDEQVDESERTQVRLQMHGDPFEHLAGRTHPFTENRGVGRGLVVGVVDGVDDGLGGQDPADQEQADGQADGDKTLKGSSHDGFSTYSSVASHYAKGGRAVLSRPLCAESSPW